MSSSDLQTLLATRRSHYLISNECDLSPSELQTLLTQAVKHTPSMFNMQSTRAVLLFGESHRVLWTWIKEGLGEVILAKRPNVASEHYETVEQKIDTLLNGHGTVVFFEDTQVIDDTCAQYPAYTPKLPGWADQSSAIAQYAFWLSLTAASPSTGTSLQHYYPDMDKLRAKWDIPASWRMTGQMPFGKITGEPKAKELRDEGELVRVFKE